MKMQEWQATAQKLRDHADKVAAEYREHARELCQEAGLDPNLLGIHPHNALCGLASGEPWPNVDYNKVKLCKWYLDNMWLASRAADELTSELYKTIKWEN